MTPTRIHKEASSVGPCCAGLAELKADLTNCIYLVAGLIIAAVFAMLGLMP